MCTDAGTLEEQIDRGVEDIKIEEDDNQIPDWEAELEVDAFQNPILFTVSS